MHFVATNNNISIYSLFGATFSTIICFISRVTINSIDCVLNSRVTLMILDLICNFSYTVNSFSGIFKYDEIQKVAVKLLSFPSIVG